MMISPSSSDAIRYARLKKLDRRTHQEIRALVRDLVGNAAEQRYMSAVMARAVRDPRTWILVARQNRTIVGMATLITMFTPSGLYGMVEDVVVAEASRGRGIGKKLMRIIIAEARRRGLSMLELTSSPSRVAANHLYQSLGFKKRETNPYRLTLTHR